MFFSIYPKVIFDEYIILFIFLLIIYEYVIMVKMIWGLFMGSYRNVKKEPMKRNAFKQCKISSNGYVKLMWMNCFLIHRRRKRRWNSSSVPLIRYKRMTASNALHWIVRTYFIYVIKGFGHKTDLKTYCTLSLDTLDKISS